MADEVLLRLAASLVEADAGWKPSAKISKERALAHAALDALLSPSPEMVEAMRKSVPPGQLSPEQTASVYSTGIIFLLNELAK